MKIIVLFSLLLFNMAEAQDRLVADSLKVADSSSLKITRTGKPGTWPGNTIIYDTSIDNRPHNKYGDLLNDDPAYNPKYAWWKPAVRVFTTNVFSWAVSKYIFQYDWANISVETWNIILNMDGYGMMIISEPTL